MIQHSRDLTTKSPAAGDNELGSSSSLQASLRKPSSGMLRGMFTSGQQQQPPLVGRLNSELSMRVGSAAFGQQKQQQQHSDESAGGAAAAGMSGGGGGGGGGGAATATTPPAAAPAALASDPLLQPGVLEAVNLKVDGRAVRQWW